ncbi:hypothetical protein C8R45DRAFT_1221988 [Mycena sanguinolenta]|nr:hypothetical protein C8R45DRAFT_1221988 [Mycena sanguinolenta]
MAGLAFLKPEPWARQSPVPGSARLVQARARLGSACGPGPSPEHHYSTRFRLDIPAPRVAAHHRPHPSPSKPPFRSSSSVSTARTQPNPISRVPKPPSLESTATSKHPVCGITSVVCAQSGWEICDLDILPLPLQDLDGARWCRKLRRLYRRCPDLPSPGIRCAGNAWTPAAIFKARLLAFGDVVVHGTPKERAGVKGRSRGRDRFQCEWLRPSTLFSTSGYHWAPFVGRWTVVKWRWTAREDLDESKRADDARYCSANNCARNTRSQYPSADGMGSYFPIVPSSVVLAPRRRIARRSSRSPSPSRSLPCPAARCSPRLLAPLLARPPVLCTSTPQLVLSTIVPRTRIRSPLPHSRPAGHVDAVPESFSSPDWASAANVRLHRDRTPFLCLCRRARGEDDADAVVAVAHH